MGKIARHIRVVGRVQGVFFRAWTREQAERLGVNGWIRNCSDGSVEAYLEGRQGGVDQLIELLRCGPSGARVDDLQVEEAQPQNHDWFAIRH